MAQTKVATLIDHLVSLWRTNEIIGGHRLQVIDGPAAVDIRNDVLFIGHSLMGATYSANGVQQWATLGAMARGEQLTVNCSLRVATGNKDLAGCRARAIEIFEALAESFRGNAAKLTANGEFQQIQLARFQLYQEFANGASVTVEFVVSAIARV